MKKPLVSIIVPVYNVEVYLNECVRSLVNQTYRDLEILLIDDGSSDQCPAICDRWAGQDKRICVIHTTNKGVSHARNIGLDNASGDYIGFVDADDWIDPDYYEKMMSEILRTGADICGVGYIHETIEGAHNNILRKEKPYVYSRKEILCEIFSCSVPKILWWELCDKLFCRDIIRNNRLDEQIFNGEDKLFFWQVMKHVKRFAYLPIYGYHYRIRKGSAINGGITEKSMSFIHADRKIFDDSKHEKEPLKSVLWGQYVSALIMYVRGWMILAPDTHRMEIYQIQKYIRKNFFRIQKLPLPIRQRLGSIYLLLPFGVCKFLRLLVMRRTDKN